MQGILDEKRVCSVEEIRADVFTDLTDQQGKAALVNLVSLAACARPLPTESSLLPARYHIFVRALEGGYVRLYDHPKLYLTPRHHDKVNGREVLVFEAAICTNCVALFLVGQRQSGHLREAPLNLADHVGASAEFFWISEDLRTDEVPDNEDENVEGVDPGHAGPQEGQETFVLCTACGRIAPAQGTTPMVCKCGERQFFRLIKAETPSDDMVKKCPACGRRAQRRTMISRFTLGKDAPVAVLASSLYTDIPERTLPDQADNGIGIRQFLSFADSRQDAAFFAPYIERTHTQILWRRTCRRRFPTMMK